MWSGSGPQPVGHAQPVAHGQPVVGQPAHGYAGGPPAALQPVVPMGSGSWTNGLCDCGAPGKCDCATCAMATFCPWGLHGATAKMMRTGHRYDACSGWDAPECAISAGLYVGGSILSCVLNATVGNYFSNYIGGLSMISYTQFLRKNVRERYGIEAPPLGDFCCHCWCTPCAAAQEHHEVKTRLPPPDPYGGVPHTMYVQPTAQSMGAPPPYAGPHAPQQQPYAPQQQPYAPQQQPHAPQGSYGAQPSASTYPKT
jgi:Cys-rich protein (TIGR01571 family)